MFFEGWYPLLRIVIVGALAYAFLIALVRISGKRTLGQMNTFDFVVNVALGSIFATLILSKDVVLMEGITALALLAGMQFAVTSVIAKYQHLRKAIDAEPTLLFRNGEYLRSAMEKQRITEADILNAARSSGVQNIGEVGAIVLETDGTMSVIKDLQNPNSALRDVR